MDRCSKIDLGLYAGIAGLTAALAWDREVWDWRFFATVLLAVLVAVKAKRSPGTEATKEE